MTQPPDFEALQPPQQPQQPTEQSIAGQAPKSPTLGYEFTMAQDDVIRALSKKMKFVGAFYVVVSAIVGLAGLGFMFLNAWIGLFYMVMLTPELLIGIWTLTAAKSFKLVVDTKGHDVPHLMNALNSLRKLYTMIFWILIIALVFMVIAIVAAIVLISSGIIPIPTESTTVTSML